MIKQKMFTKIACLLIGFCFANATLADNVNLGGGNRGGGNTSTSTGNGRGGSGGSGSNTTGGVPAPTGGGSYNGAASQSRGDANMNAAMNGAMGAYFMSGCSWASWWNCVLGGISFIQAGRTLDQARKAGNIANLTGKPGEYCPNCDGNGGDDPSDWGGSGLPPDQVIAYKKLVDMGYKMGKDGSIAAPDGRVFKPEDFANEQSMINAGVPAGAASSLAKSMAAASAEIAKKFADGGGNVVAMGIDGGGGGRSPASYDAGNDTSFDDYLKRLRNPFGMNANQKQQMLAGKSLSHGSDQIGVKEDDIFRMVHRRYQERRAGDDFIEVTTVASGGSASAAPTKTAPRITTPKGK